MSKTELKIFGAFRTSTNLVRSLLELNYNVRVHNNNYAYKHIPVPANFKNNKYLPFPLGIITTVKDPFAFLDSTFRYCQKNNYLNISAGETFDEFCYQQFVVFDGGFDEFPQYRFANPIQYWNSIYHNLLSLPSRQNFVLRYEDLLENMEGEIVKIGEKYDLVRKTKKLILPTGITINLADPERFAPKDYFQDTAFERKEYYLERQYMERFTDAQKDFIYSELDQDILHTLSYPQSSSLSETQANKTSFVNDLRRLVILGQERIPQLETSLAAERETKSKIARQLDQFRAKVRKLESQKLEETLQWESTASTLNNKLLEERGANAIAVKELTFDLQMANSQISDLQNKLEGLTGQLTEACAGIESRDAQLEDRSQEIKDLGSQLGDKQAKLVASVTEFEITKTSLERTQKKLDISNKNTASLEENARLNQQSQTNLVNELEQSKSRLKQTQDELNRAKTNYYDIRDSFSFKLGYDLVHAFAKPGKNTLAFPLRVFRNLKSSLSKEKPSWDQNKTLNVEVQPVKLVAHLESETTKPLKQMSEINVACIFDEFTTEGYQGECNLISVPLHGWVELFSTAKPDLLFVESAWRGNGGQWEYKIGKYAEQDGSELSSLVKWCNENEVPTVFWNKEDPVHYEKFIESAKQFDVIFTTDDGQITSYRDVVGHDNVFAMQFAAQPQLHNPIKTVDVEDKVCFAGSYYLNIHDVRRNEMNEILDIAKAYGLVIYDRNYERNLNSETEFSFPERFRENIVGSLKYNEMDLAYKGYKYCLNVNSIKNSNTMFSRRVFESMACGTPVLSTWSLGIEQTFGELILMTGKSLGKGEILAKLNNCENSYRKLAVQGIREVYNHHLYSHRFSKVLEKACIDVSSEACFSVKMICIASNVAEADRAIGQFQTQSFREKSLLLLLDFNAGVETILNKAGTEFGNVTIFHLNSALTLDYKMAELVDTTHVAFMNTDNQYGEHFLTDLAHAAIYTDANVIGKAAFFRLAGDELKIVDGEEYRFTNLIFSTSSIMDSSLIGEHRLQDVTELFRGDKTVEHFFGDTAKCFSTNRFNFIESAYFEKISDMKKHRLLADA